MKTEPATSTPLHILSLTLVNVGIIKAAAINPDGSPVILAGDNGAGKSTILNAIESVLHNRKLADPVTHGQERGNIRMELGEPGSTTPLYRIEQIIKKGTDGEDCWNLKIVDAEGKQVPSPTAFIESLIASGAALDPTEIMQPRPGERPETFAKRQAETLMERLGLTEQAKGLDEQIKEKAARRTEVNKEVESRRARMEAIQLPANTPSEPVDVSAVTERLLEYKGLQTKRERLSEQKATKDASHAHAVQTTSKLRAELKAADEREQAAKKEAEGAAEMLEHFDDMNPIEGVQKAIGEMETVIKSATETNAAVAKRKERNLLSTELATAEQSAHALTTEISSLREQRLDLVRSAKLPVEGLELTEDALLFRGKPLAKESTGNRIRVCAMLAMAEKPDCRVLIIREGSLTNRKNLQIIYDLARERGYQTWVEAFSEQPQQGALWIEGGRVQG
jgi:DNA repair exonuclease SbcCD ATPase subunit